MSCGVSHSASLRDSNHDSNGALLCELNAIYFSTVFFVRRRTLIEIVVKDTIIVSQRETIQRILSLSTIHV